MGNESFLLKQLAERQAIRKIMFMGGTPLKRRTSKMLQDCSTGEDEQAIFDYMERKHQHRNNYGYHKF